MLTNIVCAISLIYIFALFLFTIIKICKSNREERIKFLKSFKKGKFIFMYFIAIPLYFIALQYNYNNWAQSLFSAIEYSIGLIILKFQFSSIAGLLNESLFFEITIIICYFTCVLNALALTFAIVGENLSNFIRLISATRFRKKSYIIVGYNKNSISIAKSIPETVLIIDKLDSVACEKIYIDKNVFIKMNTDNDLAKILKKLFGNFRNNEVNLIINTEDDKTNLIYAQQICDLIDIYNTRTSLNINRNGINAYIFANPNNQSVFDAYEDKSKGAIKIINKYKLLAMDFANDNNILKFMENKFLDKENCALIPNAELNIILLGFGKTGQHLLPMLTTNTYVYCLDDNCHRRHIPIRYTVIDKEDARFNKNLNHRLYRYSREFSQFITSKSDYLPIEPIPYAIEFQKTDINDTLFYQNIKTLLEGSKNSETYSQIIVNIGDDLQNIDIGKKLTEKLNEWNLSGNIFVNISDNSIYDTLSYEFKDYPNLHLFGNENDVVYNFNRIANEKMERMAIYRHINYALQKSNTSLLTSESNQSAVLWFQKFNCVQRESNVYALLSLRLKLNLLGFDYVDIACPQPDASSEFYKKYFDNSKIKYLSTSDRNIIDYDASVSPVGSLRYDMAILEHTRWNAYMISQGFVPADKNEILTKSSKELFRLRKHANLTSFDGLKEYAKLMATKNNTTVDKFDVTRYDYQILDDAQWILSGNGYKIVEL